MGRRKSINRGGIVKRNDKGRIMRCFGEGESRGNIQHINGIDYEVSSLNPFSI
jgi:hypothetical protein